MIAAHPCDTRPVVAPLCRFDDMPIGMGLAFTVSGRTIALFRTRSGTVRALDNRCPHKGGPLADGIIAGSRIVCPLHAFRYDLNDGSCDADGHCSVAAYPTRVVDGWVCIDLPQ